METLQPSTTSVDPRLQLASAVVPGFPPAPPAAPAGCQVGPPHPLPLSVRERGWGEGVNARPPSPYPLPGGEGKMREMSRVETIQPASQGKQVETVPSSITLTVPSEQEINAAWGQPGGSCV